MREILEELYYGNTMPCDRQIRSGTSLMKAMEQPQECEEKLTKLPEGEAHSLLLRLINAENEIGSTMGPGELHPGLPFRSTHDPGGPGRGRRQSARPQ